MTATLSLEKSLKADTKNLLKLARRTRSLFRGSTLKGDYMGELNPKYASEFKGLMENIYEGLTSQEPVFSYSGYSDNPSFGMVKTNRPDLVALDARQDIYTQWGFFDPLGKLAKFEKEPVLANLWSLFISSEVRRQNSEVRIPVYPASSTEVLLTHSINNCDKPLKFYEDERFREYSSRCVCESLSFVSTDKQRTDEWVNKVERVYKAFEVPSTLKNNSAPLLNLRRLSLHVLRSLSQEDQQTIKHLIKIGEVQERLDDGVSEGNIEISLVALKDHYDLYHLK